MIASNRTMRCHDCGQAWQLHATDVFNHTPPRFCPACGTFTLERSMNVLGTAEARCFKGINPQLVTLLYQTWRSDDATQREHPRFVDWMRATLRAAVNG